MIKRYEACFLFKSEEIEYKGSLEEVKKSLEFLVQLMLLAILLEREP